MRKARRRQDRRGKRRRALTPGRTGNAAGRSLRLEPLEDRRVLAVITVDTELDVVDFSDNLTSLREAIFAANTVAGADEIRFDFGHDGPETIFLEEGQLEITEALTITGDGPELFTIDAQQQSTIFRFTAETGDFTLADMTLTGGLDDQNLVGAGAVASFSSGLLTLDTVHVTENALGESLYAVGAAAVLANGSAEVFNSEITRNEVLSDMGGSGGIAVLGSLLIEDSTVSRNDGLPSYDVAAVYQGGAIHGGAEVTVVRTTVADNYVYPSAGTSIRAAGITALGGLELVDSQVNDNTNDSGDTAGGVWGAAGVSLVRSEVSGNVLRHDDYGAFGAGGISGASVALTDSVVTGNTVEGTDRFAPDFGGGAGGVRSIGNVTITGSVISANEVTGYNPDSYGGGVYSGGDVVITSSVISDNRLEAEVAAGAGVFASGAATIVDSVISGNFLEAGRMGVGGGVAAGGVSVSGSTLQGNTVLANFYYDSAYLSGGLASAIQFPTTGTSTSEFRSFFSGAAIYSSGDLSVISTAVTENQYPAAVATYNAQPEATTVLISQTTISSNGAGVALWGEGPTELVVDQSTIVRNQYVGLFADGKSVTITNSIVAENETDDGETGFDIDVDVGETGTLTYTHSLIGVEAGLADLADNGGPTQTHALLPDSPAIDMGDPNVAFDPEEYDQRGEGFARVIGGRVDIGAFEVQTPAGLLSGDYNGDRVVDAADFTVWRDAYGATGLAPYEGADGDGDGAVTLADYELWKANFGAGESAESVAPAASIAVASSPVVAGEATSDEPIATSPERPARDRLLDGAFALFAPSPARAPAAPMPSEPGEASADWRAAPTEAQRPAPADAGREAAFDRFSGLGRRSEVEGGEVEGGEVEGGDDRAETRAGGSWDLPRREFD